MRLLLAEDEAAMSEALKDILTYHKYQVDTVDNGEDALAYAQVGEYDGIILDIMMPKMISKRFGADWFACSMTKAFDDSDRS